MDIVINDPTIEATARTLRHIAGWIFITDEERGNILYEMAKDIERTTDVDDWWCCPVCQEVECDEGCPLEKIRRES